LGFGELGFGELGSHHVYWYTFIRQKKGKEAENNLYHTILKKTYDN